MRGNAPTATAVGDPDAGARQFGFEVRRQLMHCPGEISVDRQDPDQRIIGSEKDSLESLERHVEPLGPIVSVKALLPRHTISVERAAKIKKQRFDGLHHLPRACAPTLPNRRPGSSIASSPTRSGQSGPRLSRRAPPPRENRSSGHP